MYTCLNIYLPVISIIFIINLLSNKHVYELKYNLFRLKHKKDTFRTSTNQVRKELVLVIMTPTLTCTWTSRKFVRRSRNSFKIQIGIHCSMPYSTSRCIFFAMSIFSEKDKNLGYIRFHSWILLLLVQVR